MSSQTTAIAMFSFASTRTIALSRTPRPKLPARALCAVTAQNIGIVTVHTTMHHGQPTPMT
ncbi:Uncharacterised protein [Mycobacteroides abscessus subsp. abscessus]|nr:Uncharacterised protein [Mycobacteroides abscessus subsp. abscessus]